MFTKQFFRYGSTPHSDIDDLPEAPPWRQFTNQAKIERGAKFHADPDVIEIVNAALLLRRPLLVTGKPGTGKSSLAYAIAYQLTLGKVLNWSITTRSTLQAGLYQYDAIARLQDTSLAQARGLKDYVPDIGRYIRLGPLGTAFPPGLPSTRQGRFRPRVLLIDEIDKSDIDLPNDLLNIFEEGEFYIPELARLPKGQEFDKVAVLPYDSETPVWIERGHVRATEFPVVIMTSNEEREFPPAFLRRCLRLDVKPPTPKQLEEIVRDRLNILAPHEADLGALKKEFLERRDEKRQDLSTDQLLNAVYLVLQGLDVPQREVLKNALLKSLSGTK